MKRTAGREKSAMASTLLFALTMGVAGISHALDCDDIGVAGNPHSYEEKDDGTPRCEGVYRSDIGAPLLRLVALVRGAFPLRQSVERLFVHVPKVEGETVGIRAAPTRDDVYYRMDALVPSAGTMDWPISVSFDAIGLHISQIGAFGCVGACKTEREDGHHVPNEKDKIVYVPVSLSASSDRGPDSRSALVHLVLCPTERVYKVEFRYASFEGGRCQDMPEDWTAWGDSYSPNDTIDIEFEPGPGTHCVEVRSLEDEFDPTSGQKVTMKVFVEAVE